MTQKRKVGVCKPNGNKPIKTGNSTIMSTPSAAAAQYADTSEANRQRLQDWADKTEYKNITFWITPDVNTTPDQCIAEVGKALVKFSADKKSGKISPVKESSENNL
jgi:hypothetical protein